MSPLVVFVLGGLTGMLFKDTVKAGLRGVAKSSVRTIKELSEDIEDLKAEAESEQRVAKTKEVIK